MSKAVSDYLSMVDYLPEIHDRISRVIIEKVDILELLNKYDNPIYDPLLDNGFKKKNFKSPSSESIETVWYNT